MLYYTVCLAVHVIVKTTDGNCVCSVTIFVCDGCSCSPVFLKCLHSNLDLLLPRFIIFMYRIWWVALLSLNLCLFHHAGNEQTSYCRKTWHIIRFFFTEDNAASFHNHPMLFSWLCSEQVLFEVMDRHPCWSNQSTSHIVSIVVPGPTKDTDPRVNPACPFFPIKHFSHWI